MPYQCSPNPVESECREHPICRVCLETGECPGYPVCLECTAYLERYLSRDRGEVTTVPEAYRAPKRRSWGKRLLAVLLSLALVAAVISRIPFNAFPKGPTATVSISGMRDYEEAFAVLELTNQERAKESLAPLTMDTTMLEAAMQRAAETLVYWSHTRPDGTASFTALPFGNSISGENIAVGQENAAIVVDGWMNSEGHRENIMNGSFTTIGVGCFYQGNLKYWVQVFGDKPAVPAAQLPNAVVSTPVRVLKSNPVYQLLR